MLPPFKIFNQVQFTPSIKLMLPLWWSVPLYPCALVPLYPLCTLVYPRCTLAVPSMYPWCTLGVPSVYPQCALGVPLVYPRVPSCTLAVPFLVPFPPILAPPAVFLTIENDLDKLDAA